MDFLNSACIPPEAITASTAPQTYLDGFAIPIGFPTLFGVAGGSGKTTALMQAAITASATGQFPLFGCRDHGRPLRCVLVFGEESSEGLGKKIMHELKALEHYRKAVSYENGNLKLVSWEEFMDQQERPEPVFDREAGALTASGERLFEDLIEYEPDFVAFDTLKSLSQADYNLDTTAYRTMSELRKLARRSGAAVVMTTHLTKAGRDKITPDSDPTELTGLLKGSGSLVDASRHTIVMLPAKRGDYSNIKVAENDTVMMTAVKTNVQGCELNSGIFPTVRSSAQRTFIAVDGTGKPLREVEKERDQAIRGILYSNLPGMVAAAARLRRPFAQKPAAATSVEALSQAALSDLFHGRPQPRTISRVLDELERNGLIVRCVNGRTGTGGVWDVPEGVYANEDLHVAERRIHDPKYKLEIKKGAPNEENLRKEIGSPTTELELEVDAPAAEA